ncbi:Kynureninase (L-kynurenine hydrolase), partial [Coemansia sp. RSA 2708]
MDQLQMIAADSGLDLDSQQFAQAMDARDPLAHLRSEFVMPTVSQVTGEAGNDKACVYMCGNSLGLQPKRARRMVCEELDEWANG